MPRHAKGLSAAKVAKAKPGRYGDGRGLYLTVRDKSSCFWVFRYVRAGKMTEMGLGPARGPNKVDLHDARLAAAPLWEAHKAGRDPLTERRAGRAAITAASIGSGRTFKQAAAEYIEAYRSSWRNAVHARQWETSLSQYVYPVIGDLSVDTIATAHVAAVLQPIWIEKTETASRIRGRIELILGREKALKHRSGENPARWKENLDQVLPNRKKVQSEKKHHSAMPAAELGDFMTKLRANESTSGRALEFTILTCARTAEVLGARWDEMDTDARIWTVPGTRMKGAREHRVPLSTRAVEILKQMRATSACEYVFTRPRGKTRLSPTVLMMRMRELKCEYTVHGFRSTFADWAGDHTNFQREVIELALAHTVGDETERAYRRGDGLQKRFQLSEKWSEFCAQPSRKKSGEVVALHA